MGGHSLPLAAAMAPEAFAELILIDPVIMPPALYTGRPREPHFRPRRRNQWTSPDEMFESFKDRLPSAPGTPRSCATTATYGLVPAGDGNGLRTGLSS